jgi:RNA-binding protein YlmH
MKTNIYNDEKIIEHLYNYGYTNFLTMKELASVKGKLNKNEFHVYYPYPDASKVLLYKKDEPIISLLKIEGTNNLRHQDIMGTIFKEGLREDSFGDIVKYNNDFYLFVLPHLKDDIKYHMLNIRNETVKITEVDLNIKDNFKQEYINKEFIVSSLRIDNIVSTITNESRNSVLDKFKNKEIILNYEETIKPTRVLREGDIFSIRRYGKYKFNQILKNTKKGGYIIEILMYK